MFAYCLVKFKTRAGSRVYACLFVSGVGTLANHTFATAANVREGDMERGRHVRAYFCY